MQGEDVLQTTNSNGGESRSGKQNRSGGSNPPSACSIRAAPAVLTKSPHLGAILI